MTTNKAFRDYATHISFNLSLSRNQVGHLAGVVAEQELDSQAWSIHHEAYRNAVAATAASARER